MYANGNGLVKYTGEVPLRPSGGPKPATLAQLQALNPTMYPTHGTVVYDPHDERRRQHTRQEFAAVVGMQAGLKLSLTANGTVEEVPAPAPIDPRLAKALQGRTPKDEAELNQWLKDAGVSEPGERMALALAYGPLKAASAPPQAITHTLGSLGLRRQTKLTAAQFAAKLQHHGVPVEHHVRLAFEAYEAGHIVPEGQADDGADADGAATPGVTLGKRRHDGTSSPGVTRATEHHAMNAAIDRRRRELAQARGWVQVGDMTAATVTRHVLLSGKISGHADPAYRHLWP